MAPRRWRWRSSQRVRWLSGQTKRMVRRHFTAASGPAGKGLGWSGFASTLIDCPTLIRRFAPPSPSGRRKIGPPSPGGRRKSLKPLSRRERGGARVGLRIDIDKLPDPHPALRETFSQWEKENRFKPLSPWRGVGVRVGSCTAVIARPDPHPPGRSPSASEAMDGRERPALRATFSRCEKGNSGRCPPNHD